MRNNLGWVRPHLWLGEVCARCDMRRSWAGAKDNCAGLRISKRDKDAKRSEAVWQSRTSRVRDGYRIREVRRA